MHLVDAHYHLRQDEVISIITGQFFLYIVVCLVRIKSTHFQFSTDTFLFFFSVGNQAIIN